ncbi:hypothetical protein CgunFtcFv8_012628 [Champsocephalus gunnari]|uniref:CortBP2/NAV1-like AAA+ ATPase lid domain-containing protein n=1 Tax=Champsocephalus gunnari TaxID=52237 RepID=A0AAN8HY03_CHAGU|nr:hypothetical protein CgunFtcFv8_012628 [Champsocephalus gunnari]
MDSHLYTLPPPTDTAAVWRRCCLQELLWMCRRRGGRPPSSWRVKQGSLESVRVLLSAGAERSLCTADGCSSLHAAVRSGHVDTLRLLLCYRAQALLNRDNSDGWTAAHMAAALGLKECLEVLCSHGEQDIERRDKCNRTIHDVATDDCKDLLENLHSYRVLVLLQCSGGGGLGSMCPVEALEEEAQQGVHPLVLGRVTVHRDTPWSQLRSSLSSSFTSFLSSVCGEEEQRPPLGLSSSSIASFIIGDTAWSPDQELPLSPWDLVRKPLSQSVTIRLKGLSESCLHESALESLFPLPLLHNYVRLVEQYGNLIFHGLEGSCLEFIANLVARCIKVSCCPRGGSGSRCVLVLLEGLERASSLSGLMGDLCLSLDSRGSGAPLHLSTGPHHFSESSFLIGTLSRPRLQGPELRLQQHFRWVTLRWDQEPLQGMLGRHLRRKLIHKTGSCLPSPSSPLQSSVLWVRDVWQQLNACLSRLGTPEALIGPQLFLSCPVLPGNTHGVIRWLSRLWNAVVVPRVEEAVIARVTARRSSTTTSTSSTSSQRPSLSNTCLSAGQQAVVKAALSILVNKAVLQGCPLPRHEIDRYLLEFRGGTFPLSAISSYKGEGGGRGGGRKGRDSGKLRRSNTSPRKKGGTPNWSSGGSFREGSLSSTDVSFIPKVQREPTGLSVFSDDETDLIRELQTMCSSKSEPDISKISETKDDLILFSSSSQKAERETPVQMTAPSPGSPVAVQSSERRSGPAPRSKSQLPVPSSSRGGAGLQTRTPPIRSRTKQAPPTPNSSSSNNNYYRNNNMNENSQSQEDIWILHENNNNK